MIRRETVACLLVGVLACAGAPHHAGAQVWSADLSAGRTVYDPLSADVGANNLVGSLRYDTRRSTWVYGAAASPLGSQAPFWGAAGTGGRFTLPRSVARGVTIGADLGAHGFLFRDAVAAQAGTGGMIDAMPFVGLSRGAAGIELRGGWRGQTLSFAGVTEQRGVVETGARGTFGTTVRLQGDARLVHAAEGTYPFIGTALAYGGAPVQWWAQAGRWLSDELDDVAWGGGASVALGMQASLWASVRQEAPDPLYWNAARRTWTVGVTRRFGRGPVTLLPAPRSESGRVAIRVPVADAPAGAVAIAGDFNEWRPVPMLREGGDWVIRLPLDPGVYTYSFRSETGQWFVPSSVPGRRDDGFGGHVAVLVVS